MRRRTTASALAAVGVLAALATGQPPAAAPKAPADPTDALIQKALANDPDVQVARAKLALAEAEVAKARQAAVARVITLRDTIEQQRQAVTRSQESFAIRERMVKTGQVSREELLQVQDQLATARAALARAETELRLLTGDGPKAAAGNPSNAAFLVAALLEAQGKEANADTVARAMEYLGRSAVTKASSGPIPDRIRAALDKTVRLGGKGDGIALDAAMEVFKKEAGLDVPIRGMPSPTPRIVLDGEELSVGAWFQMFQDHGQNREGLGFRFYVREYGLLVANSQTAPSDAMTLTEFWRARPAAAAPVPKQPDQKEPAGERVEVPHDKAQGGVKAKLGVVVVVTFPVKTADVEDAKLGADGVASARMGTADGRAAVLVWANRAGRATVTWEVTTADGRRFSNRGLTFEFE